MNTTKRIIVNLSTEDHINNRVPEWVFDLLPDNDVFIKDKSTGELIQVFDFKKKYKANVSD